MEKKCKNTQKNISFDIFRILAKFGNTIFYQYYNNK